MDYYYVRAYHEDDSTPILRINENEYKLLKQLEEFKVCEIEDVEIYFSDEN